MSPFGPGTVAPPPAGSARAIRMPQNPARVISLLIAGTSFSPK
jgi:hypothetical protein